MTQQIIALASDHAGYALKTELKEELERQGHEVLDLGTHGPESVDYPDFGHAMGQALEEGRAQRGVLVCGSGIGISIAANRHPGVRAALYHRRLRRYEKSIAAYGNAIAHYENVIKANPANRDSADRAIALAHAARARVAYQLGDDDRALTEILASFDREPMSAGTRDGSLSRDSS